MDKYEFNLKMEQMKKLIHEEDYVTAFRIADSIDWNRVRNINLLTMAATVYEKNDRLEDAKRILNLALDRAPVGKRLLYKLTELAVRTGDLEQAENYYYEYRGVDAEDIGNYLLQYMILKARHAPYDRQLQPLELYCQRDPDEQWLYELATSYEFAGRTADCVRTCDRIALLYGNSAYSLKALRLKMRYADLTPEQKNILYPRSESENGMTAGQTDAGYANQSAYATDYYEQSSIQSEGDDSHRRYDASDRNAHRRNAGDPSDVYSEYGLTREPDISSVTALKQEAAEEYENTSAEREAAIRNSDALAAARYENEDAAFDAYVLNMERAAQQQAAEEARRAEEERLAAIKAENEEKEARARAEAMKFQAQAQQAAMEKQAEQNRRSAEEQKPQAAGDETDGQQMAFDFGDGAGEPRVVEEQELPEVPAEPQLSGAEAIAAAATQTAVSAAETALNNAAQLAAAAAIPAAAASAPAPAPAPAPAAPVSTIDAVEAALNGAAAPAVAVPKPAVPAAEIPVMEREERPAKPVSNKSFHMIVEAETVEDGLKIAIDELKAIHEENNIQHASAKTTADKLNSIGFTDSVVSKIRGKDFVIERAGDLDEDVIDDIYKFIRNDRTGTIVVLIDTPEGLDNIEDVRPELFDICDYVSDIDDEEFEETDVKKKEKKHQTSENDDYDDEPYEDEAADDDIDDIDDSEHEDSYDDEDDYDDDDDDDDDEFEEPRYEKKEPHKRSSGKVKEKFNNVRTVAPAADGDQMEIDDFAQYCTQYASEIDCSISGKSMLALYERIELMEEDGIPLTKANAEALIEEAADRAEKPPIGKRLTGVFHSRYDKNGCLILKEDDFIH